MVEKIIHLRKNYHFGPTKISMYLRRYHDVSVSSSGVWRILKRALGGQRRMKDSARKPTQASPIYRSRHANHILVGEDFLYGFKPGRHGPDAPPLHPAMRSLPLRSASAPGG